MKGESGIFTFCAGQSVYIRVIGRGSFQNSRPLERFTANMIESGCRQFVLDLEQCAGMDSTFMGVLTGVGIFLRQQVPPGIVHVIRAGSHNREVLKSLWLDRLFRVTADGEEQAGLAPPTGADFLKLPDSDLSCGARPFPREEIREVMLTAHDDLIRADCRNAPKFSDVTRQLREDSPPPQMAKPESDSSKRS